jgi:neutral ceramidase
MPSTSCYVAGFAKTNINHGKGFLGGYWGRSQCTGIHDHLYCTATYVYQTTLELDESNNKSAIKTSYEDNPIILISLDLVGTSAQFANQCQKEIALALNWPTNSTCRERIIISCTHTHTGPQTNPYFIGMGHASDAYMSQLMKSICLTVKMAIDNLDYCKGYHVKTNNFDDISINRRQRRNYGDNSDSTTNVKQNVKWFEISGKTILGQRPDGPIIPYAESLIFEKYFDSNILHGIVVTYSMHPTCVGKKRMESGDYCGFVCQYISDQYHNKPVTMYLNGCCGDINPIQHRSGYNGARKIGEKLGNLLVTAINNTRNAHNSNGIHPYIKCVSRTLNLPLEPLPSEEEAFEFAKQQNEWLEEAKKKFHAKYSINDGQNSNGTDIENIDDALRAPLSCCEYSLKLVKRAQEEEEAGNKKKMSTMQFNVHIVSLGSNFAFVFLPGEIFCEYELKIKAFSPFQNTFCIGYSNGCHGYFPTKAEYNYGGYEVCNAFRVYGKFQRISENAEYCILDSTKNLLDFVYNRQYLKAIRFDSNFMVSHDTYNGIGTNAERTKVYYVLCSVHHNVGAKMYSIDALNDSNCLQMPQPKYIGDLTNACGDDDGYTIAQGKSHVPFFEDVETKKLYFGTHVGFYVSSLCYEHNYVHSNIFF